MAAEIANLVQLMATISVLGTTEDLIQIAGEVGVDRLYRWGLGTWTLIPRQQLDVIVPIAEDDPPPRYGAIVMVNPLVGLDGGSVRSYIVPANAPSTENKPAGSIQLEFYDAAGELVDQAFFQIIVFCLPQQN